MTEIVAPFFTGFALSAALIMAIGAQNLFVLRQGLRREHVGPIVLLCGSADALLIILGVAGVGAFLSAIPSLTIALSLGGAAFLGWYGITAFHRMMAPDAMIVADGGGITLGRAISATAAFTLLNPHVYLDIADGSGGIGAAGRGSTRLRGWRRNRELHLVRVTRLWRAAVEAGLRPAHRVACAGRPCRHCHARPGRNASDARAAADDLIRWLAEQKYDRLRRPSGDHVPASSRSLKTGTARQLNCGGG